MLFYPLNKLIRFRTNTPEGIAAIYINTALRKLAVALVGVFLPVFLFIETQIKFGEGAEVGLYGLVAYYFIWRLVVVAFTLPSANILSRLGFRITVLISNIFLVILLWLLALAEANFWILPFAAVIHGFATPLYWLAYHSLFAEEGVPSHMGEEVGVSVVAAQLAGVAGPVLGGVVITLFGFPALFIVALIIVLISGIPFFFMPHHERKSPVSFSDVKAWFRARSHKNEIWAIFGRFVDEKTSILIWPIYMYLIVGTYERQGLVASLAMIFSLIAVYLAGKLFDRKHSRLLFNASVGLASLAWIIRGLVRTFGQLIFIESGINTVTPFYWVPFDSLTYRRAKARGERVLTFMVSRILLSSMATFAVLIVVLIFAASSFRFWAVWVLAAASVLFSSVMWEKGDFKNA